MRSFFLQICLLIVSLYARQTHAVTFSVIDPTPIKVSYNLPGFTIYGAAWGQVTGYYLTIGGGLGNITGMTLSTAQATLTCEPLICTIPIQAPNTNIYDLTLTLTGPPPYLPSVSVWTNSIQLVNPVDYLNTPPVTYIEELNGGYFYLTGNYLGADISKITVQAWLSSSTNYISLTCAFTVPQKNIQCTVPPHSELTATVFVSFAWYDSEFPLPTYTYFADVLVWRPPTITAFSPTSISRWGGSITLTGIGFGTSAGYYNEVQVVCGFSIKLSGFVITVSNTQITSYLTNVPPFPSSASNCDVKLLYGTRSNSIAGINLT